MIRKKRHKKIIVDLQVSIDVLDIVLYLLFKTIYQYKVEQGKEEVPDPTHLNLVLEEAHRYINTDLNETKLGNYYIDKLSREGRKSGIGLVISSQVPSMLSYEIISQCNSVIMYKITSKRERFAAIHSYRVVKLQKEVKCPQYLDCIGPRH